MESFSLTNQVRLGIAHALLLLYRYLTGIYALGDLCFVQFLSGYMRGEKRSLDGGQVLTVSGNGIGELEKALSLQWGLGRLETMAVTPAQMRLMRLLMHAAPEEVEEFFRWAHAGLNGYPNLQALLASPGLVPYWRQQCELWQSPRLSGRVRLFGGSPWDLPAAGPYDAVLLSHAQQLLQDHGAKQLLPLLKPGGMLAAVMPAIFRPDWLRESMPERFSDQPAVRAATQRMRDSARRAGYELPGGQPVPIRWEPGLSDAAHVVSFSIASPLRSLLAGEVLIQTLSADLPEETRLQLLESALTEVPSGEGAGTEALLILLTEKGEGC